MGLLGILGQSFIFLIWLLPYSMFLVLGFLGIKALLKYLNDGSSTYRNP